MRLKRLLNRRQDVEQGRVNVPLSELSVVGIGHVPLKSVVRSTTTCHLRVPAELLQDVS